MLGLCTACPSAFIKTIPEDVRDTSDTDGQANPNDILHRRVLVFWQDQVEVPKTSTQQCLAAQVAKHIANQWSLDEGIMPTNPVKFMELYIIFLAQVVADYLQQKKVHGLQALSTLPSLFVGGAQLPPLSLVNKALTLSQVPQQPEETPYDYVAQQAAVDHQRWDTMGMIGAPDLASTEAGLVIMIEQPVVYRRTAESMQRALTWEDRIALQQFCNGNFEDFGHIDSQNVVFSGNTAYDA
ncbi:hypothetical protein C0989_000185 [Termitomyces sp. Mn162]|nr:hypothetical protein C0989_000185 [Termitomyces sp. Mn162]